MINCVSGETTSQYLLAESFLPGTVLFMNDNIYFCMIYIALNYEVCFREFLYVLTI